MYDVVTVKTDFKNYNVFIQESKSMDIDVKNFLKDNNINGISLEMEEKFLPNIDFLSEMTQLEYLNLGRKSYENLKVIEKLVKLEYLSLEGSCEESLDLSKLIKLQDLFVLYNKKIENIFDCVNLKSLIIHHYKKKNTDEFTKLKKLEILEIWSSPIQNIDGLKDLKEIEQLELRYLRKLESIDGIKNNSSIKELWIQNCRKVTDWEVLGTLSSLRVLTIEACGNIPSLHFLDKLESLESVRLVSNTFIEDGKLSWLIDKESMKYFHTPIENHYDVSLETLSKFNNFGIRDNC
ncbi:hypothetical protein AM501_13770 [Aneurinibacillus migulanus]|uniref:leucine-rich repeat domain-containing protein n=1 Tax=Aneurinibacillus migulanus TaxID=47500 RepID=UPI0006B4A263|nr:leucine-rich repeat domain-containing protein [Aneurinibacillus migulanus]KPD07736.1 hypothetical protein AM501_13770 [Aneurinibacillus migulanus]